MIPLVIALNPALTRYRQRAQGVAHPLIQINEKLVEIALCLMKLCSKWKWDFSLELLYNGIDFQIVF